jgi:uroporphyrinogen decarboxylase
MTPRRRVLTAMRHEAPDRVPHFYRDVPEVETRLLRDLDLPDREALLRRFEIDFRWIAPEYVGPPLQMDESRRRNIWGVEFEYVPLETGGHWQTRSFPLEDATDPKTLDDYPWPRLEWFDFSSLADQAQRYADYATMTAAGPASDGILGIIQDLVGLERALVDPVVNRPFFDALIEKVLEFKLPFVERTVRAAKRLDFFRIGDDFGTQRGPLLSPAQWRDTFGPALKAVADTAKAAGATFYYQHSCGGIRPLIGDLLDIGMDVLDPIQIRAEGMEPAALKRDFGDRLCFSGGVDEQRLLPRGTPDEIRTEVLRLCDVLGAGGGYFLGPTHNFQEDIPTENIVAIYDAQGR